MVIVSIIIHFTASESCLILAKMSSKQVNSPGWGYLLIRGYWGCAAGWGRIFATGLTIMGLHF